MSRYDEARAQIPTNFDHLPEDEQVIASRLAQRYLDSTEHGSRREQNRLWKLYETLFPLLTTAGIMRADRRRRRKEFIDRLFHRK